MHQHGVISSAWEWRYCDILIFNKWLPLSVWCWRCKVLWPGRGNSFTRWKFYLLVFLGLALLEGSWVAQSSKFFSQEFYKVLVSLSITAWCVSVFASVLGGSCPACCCGRAVFALPHVTLLQFAFSKPWQPTWRADVITCWVQGVFALLFAFSVCLCESLLLWISPAREVKQMFIHNLPG